MRAAIPSSVPGIADVEVVRGRDAVEDAAVDLLVEVPHGAVRADYEALRARMRGVLPENLHEFFSVNTDVGAWELGRRVAERVIAADARRVAVVIRCRVPRTFIDCNRIEEAKEGAGLTASVPAYVRDEGDRSLLLGLHREYVDLVQAAHATMSPRGFLLLPHTYGPLTLGIERVEDDIVAKLRWAHEPQRVETWPLRPEVDLITRSAEGDVAVDPAIAAEVKAGYEAIGVAVGENATYHIHPSTLAQRWVIKFPGRVFCLEVRRDLLVKQWIWKGENEVLPDAVERMAGPLVEMVARRVR